MAAPLGNQYAVKLNSPELKKEAYKQYCQHLIEGYPKEAFCFDHENISLTWKTMEKYIDENPEDFPPILMDRAMAKRFKYWFDEGKTLMKGGYHGGSPVVWQTIMRNMFKDVKWDQKELEQTQSSSEHVEFALSKGKSLNDTDRTESQTNNESCRSECKD